MDRSHGFLVISFSSFAYHAGVTLFLTFLFFGSVMIEAVAYAIWLISVKVSAALMSFQISIRAKLVVVIALRPQQSFE